MYEQSPLVSVVIPTFNRAEQVACAVRSAFAQTYGRVEVVVVDDGSTDNTIAVLNGLSEEFGTKLRVVLQPNRGASSARNAGVEAATGEFIQFLDSDDLLAKEKVSLQLQALREINGADVALCYGRLEEAGRVSRIGSDYGCEPMAYLEALCSRTVHVMQTSAPLWPRKVVIESRWDDQISLGDDLDFHVRCLLTINEVVFVPHELFLVQDHLGDRLSHFQYNDGRLRSLYLTERKMIDALRRHGIWAERLSQSCLPFLRTLYANYLRRMSDDDIADIESFCRRVLHRSNGARLFFLVFLARRIVGRRLLNSLLTSAASLRSGLSARKLGA